MADPILLSPRDNVVITTERLAPGTTLPMGGAPLQVHVAPGHKIAGRDLSKGEAIRKFGQIIGYATEAIPMGSHVHSHNCAIGVHDRDYAIGADLEAALAAVPDLPVRDFQGYKRSDGRVGTRNMIALVSTVNCSASVIRRAAEEVTRSGVLDQYHNVDGIVAFAHGSGCGMAAEGPGWENLQRTLWGHATHPNIGAAIFVGLGCEVMQIARLKVAFGGSGEERFAGLTIQESGGTAATTRLIVDKIHALLPQVNANHRESCPASHLTLALQCGGSDGYSGMTANPALGKAADMLVGLGGTVVLSETPEIYGAEQLLLRRARNNEVGDKLLERLNWWEGYTEMNGACMDNNPSPGNKAGGLTTILEKSLGAVAKAGSTPLMDVLPYGARISSPGLVFMDTPGYDPVSATGQIAGGATVLAFTTGRGSAFGSKPAPTIKLATNDALYAAMSEDMDINCGDVISRGVPLEDKGREILEMILATASGKATKSEELGLGDNEFLPWQIGAVM